MCALETSKQAVKFFFGKKNNLGAIANCPTLLRGPSFDYVLSGPIQQTFMYAFRNRTGNRSFNLTPTHRLRLKLEDGGSIIVSQFDKHRRINSKWNSSTPVICESFIDPDDTRPALLIMHGITGNSGTVGQHVEFFTSKGYRVYVVDRRGHCPHHPLDVPHINLLGNYRDVEFAFDTLITRLNPKTDIFALGISVGAAPLMCYSSKSTRVRIKGAAMLSPCWSADFDINRKCETYLRAGMDRYLVSRLKRIVQRNEILKKHNPEAYNGVLNGTTIVQVLQAHIPFTGFPVWHEFLDFTSPVKTTSNIQVPFLCLASNDDPVSTPNELDIANVCNSETGILAVTEKGAHCGFYNNIVAKRSWADEAIWEFFKTLQTE